MKTAREFAAEAARTMGCNCDLDNWQPEPSTGHSHVCRIYKAAIAAFAGQPKEKTAAPPAASKDASVLGVYECPHRSCGAAFTYKRPCLGEMVPPQFCPQCGKSMKASDDEDLDDKFRAAAHAKWDWKDETDVEVDGVVSVGTEGAFVQGWLYVSNEEAGIIGESTEASG